MGQKRLRDLPVFYDELKKPHLFTLTATAWKTIKAVATIQGISASELIERWARTMLEEIDTPPKGGRRYNQRGTTGGVPRNLILI
jgi:hypothetical protein